MNMLLNLCIKVVIDVKNSLRLEEIKIFVIAALKNFMKKPLKGIKIKK